MISLLLRVYLLGSDIKPEMAEMHPEPCFMNLLCLLHFFSWKCNCFGITGIMGRNHTIKRVSYRVGKYDEVNLSLTEILWVFKFFFFDLQLLSNCFKVCKARGNIFIHFLLLLLLLLLSIHTKGQTWFVTRSDSILE